MNWNETRQRLIECGVSPGVLPDEWEPGINLHEADLYGANLRGADLREADLRGANIDFSTWPLWCGSFDVQMDVDEAYRLAYHICRLDCGDDAEFAALKAALAPFANRWSGIERHDLPKVGA